MSNVPIQKETLYLPFEIINNAFFENDNWILENIDKIKNIPTYIVQGRYDVVCPMMSAWDLYKKIPESKFYIIQDAVINQDEDGNIEIFLYPLIYFLDVIGVMQIRTLASSHNGKNILNILMHRRTLFFQTCFL